MLPLYKRILSERFLALPETVQALHDLTGEALYEGRCRIRRGEGAMLNALANILSLPKPSEDASVIVFFKPDGTKEIWKRIFNGKIFKSVQWQVGSRLYERLNLTTLVFDIYTDETMLDLRLQEIFVLGIPMKWLFKPEVLARETEQNGQFHFHIRTTLPGLGLLVEYEGNLVKVR